MLWFEDPSMCSQKVCKLSGFCVHQSFSVLFVIAKKAGLQGWLEQINTAFPSRARLPGKARFYYLLVKIMFSRQLKWQSGMWIHLQKHLVLEKGRRSFSSVNFLSWRNFRLALMNSCTGFTQIPPALTSTTFTLSLSLSTPIPKYISVYFFLGVRPSLT